MHPDGDTSLTCRWRNLPPRPAPHSTQRRYIVAIARGCGLNQSVWAADESAFEELIALSLKEDGPWLIGCRIDSEKPKDTTERDPPIIKDRFMRGLGVK